MYQNNYLDSRIAIVSRFPLGRIGFKNLYGYSPYSSYGFNPYQSYGYNPYPRRRRRYNPYQFPYNMYLGRYY